MHFPLVVIPCGGFAERMGKMCEHTPKFRLSVNGKPIIDHILDYWANYCVRAVVVCRSGQKTCDSEWNGHFRVDYIERNTSCVNLAILEGLKFTGAPERFLVVLGDCLVSGTFDWPYDGVHAVGTIPGDTHFARSYAVGTKTVGDMTKVDGVVEKPSQGCGIYLLRWTAISYLEMLDGITAAIGALAQHEVVVPMELTGNYRNITYPCDLEGWHDRT